MSTIEPKLVDVRTVKRNIVRGLLSAADYQQYLDGLEDCAELAETSEVVFTYSSDEDPKGNGAAQAAAPPDPKPAPTRRAKRTKRTKRS